MKRAVRAEWTKLRTLPSTAWLAAAVVVLTVGLGAATTASVDTSRCPTVSTCFEDTVELTLGGVALGQAAIVVLAVAAVTNEHGNGLVATTLAAMPRRGTVLAAKATVVSAVAVAAGTVAVAGSVAAGRAILPANGFTAAHGYPPLSPTDGPTLRAAVGTVLYLVLVALLAMGVGAVLRDTAGAVTLVLALLYLAPIVAGLVSDPRWQDRIRSLGPMTAGLSIQATVALDRLPVGPWAGIAVLALYALAALTLGALVFHHRDA